MAMIRAGPRTSWAAITASASRTAAHPRRGGAGGGVRGLSLGREGDVVLVLPLLDVRAQGHPLKLSASPEERALVTHGVLTDQGRDLIGAVRVHVHGPGGG